MFDRRRIFLGACEAVCDSRMAALGFAPTGKHHQDGWACDATYREYGREQLRFAIRAFSNQHEGSGIEGVASLRPGDKYLVNAMHVASLWTLSKRFGLDVEAFYFPDLSDADATSTALVHVCEDWKRLLDLVGIDRLQAVLMNFDALGSESHRQQD